MSDFDIEGESPMTVPPWEVPPQFVGQVPEWPGTDDDPFDDPGPTAGGLDSGPGPWFIAGYDDECSRGGELISEGEEIRADGAGGWECRSCVETDRAEVAQ